MAAQMGRLNLYRIHAYFKMQFWKIGMAGASQPCSLTTAVGGALALSNKLLYAAGNVVQEHKELLPYHVPAVRYAFGTGRMQCT
jgi:hypothetical protein